MHFRRKRSRKGPCTVISSARRIYGNGNGRFKPKDTVFPEGPAPYDRIVGEVDVYSSDHGVSQIWFLLAGKWI